MDVGNGAADVTFFSSTENGFEFRPVHFRCSTADVKRNESDTWALDFLIRMLIMQCAIDDRHA